MHAPDERAENNAVPAARTIDVGEFFVVSKIVMYELGFLGHEDIRVFGLMSLMSGLIQD
jgi:hypothetical protein